MKEIGAWSAPFNGSILDEFGAYISWACKNQALKDEKNKQSLLQFFWVYLNHN